MGEPILPVGKQSGICVYDGVEWRKAKGDADGHAQVDVLSSALPSGAATETTLSAINTELAEKLETADLALDADSHLDTHKIPHSSEVKMYYIWRVSVAAGETVTLLAETAGCGRILAFTIYVDGIATNSRESSVDFSVDGELTASTRVKISHVYYFICLERVIDLAHGGISIWDTTNHIYGCWCRFGPSFESSLKITATNGDGVNATTITCGVWVEWLK